MIPDIQEYNLFAPADKFENYSKFKIYREGVEIFEFSFEFVSFNLRIKRIVSKKQFRYLRLYLYTPREFFI